jgi:hypothetical protein
MVLERASGMKASFIEDRVISTWHGLGSRGLNAGAGVGRLGFRVRAWGDAMRVLVPLLLVVIVITRSTWAEDSRQIPVRLSVIDNGVIRLGVDLNRGGSITFLADAKSRENVVNAYDLGREIQQSYFSGPKPFGRGHHPGWKRWGWNPIAAGDVFGNTGKVISHRRTKDSIYVKCVPRQWALNGVPGECTFETWISLEASTVRIRCRLNNRRPDTNQYGARHQELPAVYTTATLHRLVTYDGDAPFTGEDLREIRNSGPPWVYWQSTENWAALVNDGDWGLGVFHPGAQLFVGGFSGTRNRGGPRDPSTGYISPLHTEIIDHNISYEYEYILILGLLKHIRSYVYQHRPGSRPDFQFLKDRQHWQYVNARDDGFPIKGHLSIRVASSDPQLISPPMCWKAKNVPKVYIRAAYHTKNRQGRLFWRRFGDKGFSTKQSVGFDAKGDGRYHTYEIDLASESTYRDTISQLRFDPVSQGNGNERVDVRFISWKPR